jgi:hypothetical protein
MQGIWQLEQGISSCHQRFETLALPVSRSWAVVHSSGTRSRGYSFKASSRAVCFSIPVSACAHSDALGNVPAAKLLWRPKPRTPGLAAPRPFNGQVVEAPELARRCGGLRRIPWASWVASLVLWSSHKGESQKHYDSQGYNSHEDVKLHITHFPITSVSGHPRRA